jgi:integrase
MLTLDQRILQ